ncbi:MAG: GIY-YIG nuclease family protein [Kiritimatiellae bacterium]|nr:GIY-YIG nuclease family protein [Kiritimatiellia bacterium]
MKRKGVIYILTNPAFPQYVKIGYAQDLEKRLKQLNRSETIPYAFRAYAVYDVESELTDKDLHAIIDSINPDLRTIENFDGKKRVKEFYAMSAEDAYHLLECIAKVSGTTDRLKRMKPEGHEIEDENTAREVQDAARRGPFRFSMCGISAGTEVVFVDDTSKRAVVDDRHVRFANETTSLSALAKQLLGCNHPVQGTLSFKYNSKILDDLRKERERNNK